MLPFDSDLLSPEIDKYVEKYMKGVGDVSTKTGMKVLHLLETMPGGAALVESIPGKGSSESQAILYRSFGRQGGKMRCTKTIAKI
jgi:4-hydroxybutyryl-CoA dehydratase/vinylacetyl-CoA-Delta-isomerase